MSGLEQGGTVGARTRKAKRIHTVAGAVALTLGTVATGVVCAQDNAPAGAPLIELEQVVVTGSRLQRSAQPGDGHAPVKTFFPEDIAALGATNVADVLKYATQEPFRSNEFTTGGSRIVQLRGLAIGNTLVLVNGRRVAASATLGAVGAFNLNTIPLSAVRRIDVLSDSASAVYGTDAVGGVVNIILKNSIEAPQVDMYYGNADGGARERRVSLGYGASADRFLFAVSADYFDRGTLLGAEREPWSNQDFRSQGGLDRRTAASPLANIARQGAGNLPGLSSPRATVPAGSTGARAQADFVATAGQQNMTSALQFASIVPASERIGATANGSFFITDSLTAFAEALYSKQEDDRNSQPTLVSGATNGLVPANNPFNPFGVPVTVAFLDTTPQITHTESDLIRATAGLRAAVGSWDGEVYVVSSSENGETFLGNALDLGRVSQALRSSDPAVALNIFQDATLVPGLLDPYRIQPIPDRLSSDEILSNAYVRGPLFELPAGDVSIVLGVEHRKDQIHFEVRSSNIFITPKRDVRSAFTEASVPIVDKNMDVPLVNDLRVTLAARYDDYTDAGDTTNPQFGLEWRLFSPLLFRASYGDAYRAPTLFDLYQPVTVVNAPQPDPRRGNEINLVALTLGGNGDLLPEESTSLSTGFVFSPDVAWRPRVAATYWKITQTNRLQTLNQLAVLANEDFLPGRVLRDAPTAADIAAGRPGRLLGINLTKLNGGNLETNGFDLDLSMNLQGSWGRFAPQLSGTLINRFRAADLPVSPITERRDNASNLGSVPELRLTAAVPWSFHGYGITPVVRYISSYTDADPLNVPQARNVDSQVLLDLQASVDFETAFGRSAWTQGFSFSVGAMNLLNKEPPFALVGAAQGIDPSQSELRERFVYATLKKSFGAP